MGQPSDLALLITCVSVFGVEQVNVVLFLFS